MKKNIYAFSYILEGEKINLANSKNLKKEVANILREDPQAKLHVLGKTKLNESEAIKR